MFSVDVRQEARGVVLTLRGEFDFDSVVQLREAGEREPVNDPGAGPVVVDCGALSFCDSSGIGALVRLWQQLSAQDRALRLSCVPPTVARPLALTGLDRILPVHADTEAALAADDHRRDPADRERPARPTERHHP